VSDEPVTAKVRPEVGDVMVTVGGVVSAPAPLPVTTGTIVPLPAVKARLVLTVMAVVGVNRTVTTRLAPTPLRENGLPDVIANGAMTDAVPETVPPAVFDTVKVRSTKLPMLTLPKFTVPVGVTANSGRATALATLEQALSLPAVSTAVRFSHQSLSIAPRRENVF